MNLWEDVDRLIARTAKSVRENMPSIAVLNPIVIKIARIVLGA